jgi:outer membrane protein assembly factor BamB
MSIFTRSPTVYITAIDTRDGATVFYDHYFDSWWAPGALGRDGTLYIGNYSGGTVWAHDGITGDPKGGFTVDVCVHACPAIGVDGTIYLSGRHLYAADPLRYREHKWVFQGGNIFESSPAVGANRLVLCRLHGWKAVRRGFGHRPQAMGVCYG